MSRAFVKEPDDIALEPPPELAPAQGPHPVTQAGLARMHRTIAALQEKLDGESDEFIINSLQRDLRYWETQAANARVMPPTEGDEIGFGSRVTLIRNNRKQTIELVGESEADPAEGRINWQAPLAQVLMGARVGDVVFLGDNDDEIAVEAVQNAWKKLTRPRNPR